MIATKGRNLLVQAMLGKNDDPDNHDKEEGGSGSKLEFDVLN